MVDIETSSPYGIGISMRDQISAHIERGYIHLVGKWKAENGDKPWEMWTEAHGYTMRVLIGERGAAPEYAMIIGVSHPHPSQAKLSR